MHEKNSQDQITKALNAVNWKVLYEKEEEGRMKGIEQGEAKATERIARKLKNMLTFEEISEITGLSIEKIEKL